MSDPVKLIGRAEKLLEKGKPDLALEEYRAAIELQPENEQLLQKTADLALSINQLGPASDMLRASRSATLPWPSANCSG
jgi:predicted Zn-dependent protease